MRFQVMCCYYVAHEYFRKILLHIFAAKKDQNSKSVSFLKERARLH